MPLILPSNSISAGGYEVDNSLRFDDGSSDYLNRTFGSGNQQIWTFSTWFKISDDNNINSLFSTGANGDNRLWIFRHNSGNSSKFKIDAKTSASQTIELLTTASFRDVSAFYHVVVAVDTTQATASNRVKLYINGSQVTSFTTATYPSQNYNTEVNKVATHYIARDNSTGYYYNGYLAETVFIDGQQLDPTSFGEFDEDTGIWKPIDVSGLTFGTNGFYLDFENSGSLGADVSGNGNNFTVNNLTSIDQTTDTPTNNYATMNPLDYTPYGTATTYSNGNVQVTTGAGTDWTTRYSFSNFAVGTGKWYVECKVSNVGTSNQFYIGVIKDRQTATINSSLGGIANGYGYYANSGDINNNGSGLSTGNSYTTNDIIGMALDLDNGTLDFYKNGVAQGSQVTGLDTNALWQFSGNAYQDSGHQWNFGNPPFTISSGNSDANNYGNFEYSVPSGYYALNTKNLAEFG